MTICEQIKVKFDRLIQVDEEKKAYLMDATEIGAERLEALAQGSEPTGSEMLAITSVLHYLGNNEAADVRKALLQECISRTRVNRSYLRCLIDGSESRSVEDVLRKYHFFVDGSILPTKRMGHFLDRLLPDLEKTPDAHKISIPVSVVRSVEEMAQNPLLEMTEGAENIARIQKADQLVVRGDEQDRTPLSTFISAFSKFKPDHSLVLLTCDPKLAKAVAGLNALGIEGEDVLVLKLRDNGTAALWDEPDEVVTETALLPQVSEEDAQPLNGDADWVQFADEDPAEDLPEEIIVEDEAPAELFLEEIIVEDEAPAELLLEEIIVEDEAPAEPLLEEIIVEDEAPAEPLLEEIIVEDEAPTEGVQPEDIAADELFRPDPVRLDSTLHISDFDLEQLLQGAAAVDSGETPVAEASDADAEVDPEVEEMKQLLQNSDEQDDENDAMNEDALKQFMSIEIDTETDEDDDLSFEDDDLDLEFKDDDQLEKLIREALQHNTDTAQEKPNDITLDGDSWIEL